MQPVNDTLTKNVIAFDAGAHVSGVAFLKGTPVFALGDGAILLGMGEGQRRIDAHDGSILVVAAQENDLLTGGDDGKVIRTHADGKHEIIADEQGRWIDSVAFGPDSACAWSAGKTVKARDGKGQIKTLTMPSSCRGLAFSPKGYRIAAAHVDGATLWFPNLSAEPERLTWKGSHLDVIWSHDARFVVTSMQENQLHGWRMPEKAHMRMSGYPAKTRSFAWSNDHNWLATSGAEAAIIWPFGSKEGPTGKAPRECGVRPRRVSRVAFHPKALVLAIGYEDGWIMLVRLTDAAELLVRTTTEGGAISALAWDALGQRLVFGTEEGPSGLLTLPGN